MSSGIVQGASGGGMSGLGIPMQDYKSPRAAVICATMVNTQTHTHRQLLAGYTISSAN